MTALAWQDIILKLSEKQKAYFHKRGKRRPIKNSTTSLSEAIWEFVPRKSKHYVGTFTSLRRTNSQVKAVEMSKPHIDTNPCLTNELLLQREKSPRHFDGIGRMMTDDS